MKYLPVLCALLIAACSTTPQAPDLRGLVIVPTTDGCLDTQPAPRRKVSIINHTGGPVTFLTYTNREPFLLYGHSHALDVVDPKSGERRPLNVSLDEFIGPPFRVTLDEGDRGLFSFEPTSWPQPGDPSTFYIVIRDAKFRPYDSPPLNVCR